LVTNVHVKTIDNSGNSANMCEARKKYYSLHQEVEKKKPLPSFFTKFMTQNINDGNYQIILERTNIVHRMLWQTTISSRFLLYVPARMDHHLDDVIYEVTAA